MTLELKRSHKAIGLSRQTYWLLALMGDIGGFQGAIVSLLVLLLGNYAPRQFLIDLERKVFSVNLHYDPSDAKQADRNKKVTEKLQ